MRNHTEEEGCRKKNKLLIVIIVLCSIGLCIAVWHIGKIIYTYYKENAGYKEIASIVVSEEDTDSDSGEPDNDSPAEEDENGEDTCPISVDWSQLKAMNEDIIAWIYSEGTAINYPIAQTDNNELYLHHDTALQYSFSGTLFADKDTTPGDVMSHLIIYGHNMKNGTMFGSLNSYRSEEYAMEHNTIWFLTPDGNYKIRIFGCQIAEELGDKYKVAFIDEYDKGDFVDRLLDASSWDFGVAKDVIMENQIIMLSTCCYDKGWSNPRYVLHGVMIPEGRENQSTVV